MDTTVADTPAITIDDAVLAAAGRLMASSGRALLGIVGAPACGKSTFTEHLLAQLGEQAASVPMDGFHLSQRQLARLGRSQRKGAPDTFDAHGYQALLARIRQAGPGETVYAPGFYRDIEEPIAASLAVPPQTGLVITEGNYLLLDESPWPAVAGLLDEIWFLNVADDRREQWLAARHQRFGLSRSNALAWIARTDRPNAQLINQTAERADRQLRWVGDQIRFDESP